MYHHTDTAVSRLLPTRRNHSSHSHFPLKLVILAAVLLLPALYVWLTAGNPESDQQWHASAASAGSAAAPVQLRPYAYASISSNSGYDIMLADGVREKRVARVKVDSVFFGNVSASLSTDGSVVAFRASGDRQGGSKLFSVDVNTGKYVQVAALGNTSEGIGAYSWSPMGNTLAFVRFPSAIDPDRVDDGYGTIYIYSVGFKAMKLSGSHGSDRLLAFSGDGLGVYVSRKQSDESLEDLVYLPISGGEGRVVYHSTPELRFSRYAVLAPVPSYTHFAFLAEGDFTHAAQNSPLKAPPPTYAPWMYMPGAPTPTPTPANQVATNGKLSGPKSLGLAVSYGETTVPVLLRRDAEDFPFLGWSFFGSSVIVGGTRSGDAWSVDLEGKRTSIDASLKGLNIATWSMSGRLAVFKDTPTTRLVTVNPDSGDLVATKYVGVTPKPAAAALKLPIPYIHQVKDTADNGDGNWACGPTSIAMALAYFKRIEPWSVAVAADVAARTTTTTTPNPQVTPTITPTPKPVTGADYAPYITNKYTAFGHTYDSTARDPRGNALAGLYGTICPGGLADWQEMAQVLRWHNLNSQFVSITWDGIVGALKRGHPVVLGNELTSVGHIILVIGYTPDGNLIVNDPYGNRFLPGYGGNDGSAVVYPWKLITPRHALEIIGTVPPPTPTPTKTATPTRTATVTGTPTSTPTATLTPAVLP